MIRVLFICTGNVCRSPLAQGVFEALVQRESLEGEIYVDSAGTRAYVPGRAPDPRAQESARRRGLDVSSQRARRIRPEDCEEFDYVLTMDEENYQTVAALCRGCNCEVKALLDYAPGWPGTEVPDPFYAGLEGFEHVLDLVEEASEGLLEEIKKKHLADSV